MTTAVNTTCRVAVCDDVSAFRFLLGAVLEPVAGVEVIGEAGNGREAVALCEREHPDVLLLDIAMPIMDGLEALSLVRAASPHTRIVMLSAFDSGAIKQEALAGGATEYLEKGAAAEEIVAAVLRAYAADAAA